MKQYKLNNSCFVYFLINYTIRSPYHIMIPYTRPMIKRIFFPNQKTSDNIWNTLWENEEGETEDINEEYLEDIVDKIMIQNSYLIDI